MTKINNNYILQQESHIKKYNKREIVKLELEIDYIKTIFFQIFQRQKNNKMINTCKKRILEIEKQIEEIDKEK